CYTMHIYTSATAFRFEEGAQEAVTVNTDFQVYPNPVADNMTLQFASVKKGDALLNVYNLLGQKMYSTSVLALEGDNLFNLNVSEFTNGTYIAEVINNGAAMRKQFVVTH
ncbi:MAG: T9SS type A sorting domain-containing protein, partial [Chitinophagales bacterium]